MKQINRLSLSKINGIGSENSRIMRNIKKHCCIIGKQICSIMPLNVDLPEGYKVIIKKDITANPNYVEEKVLVNLKKHITVSESMRRDMILFFSKDVADGLLDKFEDFLKEIPDC